jgi:dTDP-glucose 4,6-dehydratase
MRLDDGRVVPNFIVQALNGEPLTVYGEGQQTRSFCFIDDLIEGLYRLLLSDEHFPVNLGNAQEIPVLTLAEEINRLTGNTAGIRTIPDGRAPADPQRRQPDITKAKKVLDWAPKIDLETGLTLTIEDFRARL